MKRFTSVILSIFLGALAVAVGMGMFLKKANNDRQRLAELVQTSEQAARAAKDESRQAIEQANQQLDAANGEITKAQQALKSIQEERDLLLRAEPLKPASPHLLRTWKQAIDVDLGVGVGYPAGSSVKTNDKTALTLDAGQSGTTLTDDRRWLSITPYDARLERELSDALATSTLVSYVADGHLLIGRHGRIATNQTNTYVLRAQFGGVPSHLIWARADRLTDRELKDVLATLSFQN